MILRHAFLAIWIFLSLLAMACSRGRQSTPADSSENDDIKVVVGEGLTEALFESSWDSLYQPDVRLRARYARRTLFVALENRSTATLTLTPYNFAVIVDGRLIPALPGEVQGRFSAERLAPGESCTGMLHFSRLGDLTGARCVFQHPPEIRPSLCVINPGETGQ